ncbi:uncharacterized protein LOC114313345 [Camellia sinensis]|uniref:uncharacterized protein LOC114313345 n=1 Tax=Camellia sinensis TaxID=4442 RepID=UPI0010367962|nr:uncharacterized protein LOC114313345 [Camellia sinensis]
MGIPSTMRDAWANRRNSHLIASPAEDQKILNSRRCTQEGVRAGVKAASIACVASAVPTVCDLYHYFLYSLCIQFLDLFGTFYWFISTLSMWVFGVHNCSITRLIHIKTTKSVGIISDRKQSLALGGPSENFC